MILLSVSGELEPSWRSSPESSSFLGVSSAVGLPPLGTDPFLTPALVLLPVTPACIDTLGVLTTKDDSDLSFLLAGGETEAGTSGASTFLLFKGNILALMSCRLWSGLQYKKGGTGMCKTKTQAQAQARVHSTVSAVILAYQREFNSLIRLHLIERSSSLHKRVCTQ